MFRCRSFPILVQNQTNHALARPSRRQNACLSARKSDIPHLFSFLKSYLSSSSPSASLPRCWLLASSHDLHQEQYLHPCRQDSSLRIMKGWNRRGEKELTSIDLWGDRLAPPGLENISRSSLLPFPSSPNHPEVGQPTTLLDVKYCTLKDQRVDREENDDAADAEGLFWPEWLMMSSTLKKRRSKMNKHKLRKRRKKERRKNK